MSMTPPSATPNMDSPNAGTWLTIRATAFTFFAAGILIGLLSLYNNLFLHNLALSFTSPLTLIIGGIGFCFILVYGVGRVLGFAPPPAVKS